MDPNIVKCTYLLVWYWSCTSKFTLWIYWIIYFIPFASCVSMIFNGVPPMKYLGLQASTMVRSKNSDQLSENTLCRGWPLVTAGWSLPWLLYLLVSTHTHPRAGGAWCAWCSSSRCWSAGRFSALISGSLAAAAPVSPWSSWQIYLHIYTYLPNGYLLI